MGRRAVCRSDSGREEASFISPGKVEIFNVAARALTGRGVKNVAANEANFRLIQEALEEDGRDFTMDNVIDLIVRGNLGLASNDADVAQDLAKQTRAQIISTIELYLKLDPSFPQSAPDSFAIRQWIMNTSVPLADVRERVELAEELTNSYGPGSKPDQFRSFMLSVSTTEQLRQRAAAIQERQRLRSLSKDELRKLAKNELKFHGHMTTTSTLPPVPPEITAQAIRTASVQQQRRWHNQYGVEAISARAEGRA